MKIVKAEYLQRVSELSQEEQERLMSRMAGKLPKRLQKEKLTQQEAMAIQLEIEDEQLQEWREQMRQIQQDNAKKASKQALKDEKKKIPTLKDASKQQATKQTTSEPVAAKKSKS